MKIFAFLLFIMIQVEVMAQWTNGGLNSSTQTTGGAVGIGAAAPAAKLEVSSTGTGGSTLLYGGVIGSKANGHELNLVGGMPVDGAYTSQLGGHIRLGGSGRGDNDVNVIQFLQNGVEKMRINNGGSIGINTISPTQKLDVTGRLKFRAENGNSAGMWLTGTTGNETAFFGRVDVQDNTPVGIWHSGTWRFVTDQYGNVGIGTVSPGAKLEVMGQGGGAVDLKVNGRLQSASSQGGLWLSDANDGFVGNQGSNIGFWTASQGWNAFQINKSTGNVGIGTDIPDKKLTVKGTIHTNEVLVDVNGPIAPPDYVFEKEYNLLPLSEVESYIKQNKHLPEVPSAKEMEQDGLNLKEMNLLLLKKVEELTLHLIEANRRIDMQSQKLERFENLVNNK